jgi:hypothetical protein
MVLLTDLTDGIEDEGYPIRYVVGHMFVADVMRRQVCRGSVATPQSICAAIFLDYQALS